MKKNRNVVVSFFGDGAVNEGYLQEVLNFSAILKLPILLVCENNLYAMSTPTSKTFATSISKRVESYGIKTEKIDGNDVVAVNSAAKKYMKGIRNGQGPFFLECLTYRHCGHSKNDLNLYRPKDEEKEWFAKDPLILLKNKIINEGEATEDDFIKMEDEIKKEIEEAAKLTVASPEIDEESLWENLYSK